MSGSNEESLKQYVDILLDRGVSWGLIGPREGERIWDRHIANSLALVELVRVGSSLVDVGSGAGLPGIPVAIVRPDLRVTLLEPLLRRSNFLTGVVEELGLADRVSVVRGRAEDHHEQYDVVTARAVAPLDRLLGWTLPLMKPRGVIPAMKGKSAADEMKAAAPLLRSAKRQADIVEVRASLADDPTTVVRIR